MISEGVFLEMNQHLQINIDLDSIHTICINCCGLVGDVFIRVPVIEALKSKFKNAKIITIVDPRAYTVLENQPCIDEIIIYNRDKIPRFKYISNFLKTIMTLRQYNIDLVVDLYSGGTSALISKLICKRYRLGFANTKRLRKANNILVESPSFCGQWSQEFGKMLAPLGIKHSEVRKGASYYCNVDNINAAKKYINNCNDKYITLNLGTGDVRKNWPVENYVSLMLRLNIKYGFVPLVVTNPGMEHLAKQFEEQYQKHATVIRLPLLSLNEVGAFMMMSDFVITGDTSLMHVSFGLKRPTLVLFTHTVPEWHLAEDCACEACFTPDETNINHCGVPWGKNDLDINYVYGQFESLKRKISVSTTISPVSCHRPALN